MPVKTTQTLRAMIEEIAARHGMTAGEMTADGRIPEAVAARQEFFYRAMVETKFSLPVIARAARREHATMIYGVASYAIRNGLPLPRGAQWEQKKFVQLRARAA